MSILYKCPCGIAVTVPHEIEMHCSGCSSLMLPADEYRKKYPEDRVKRGDHSWEEVMAEAMQIIKYLIRSGYSSQDILGIAAQILHHGIFVTVETAVDYIRNDSDAVVALDVSTSGDILRISKANHDHDHDHIEANVEDPKNKPWDQLSEKEKQKYAGITDEDQK